MIHCNGHSTGPHEMIFAAPLAEYLHRWPLSSGLLLVQCDLSLDSVKICRPIGSARPLAGRVDALFRFRRHGLPSLREESLLMFAFLARPIGCGGATARSGRGCIVGVLFIGHNHGGFSLNSVGNVLQRIFLCAFAPLW